MTAFAVLERTDLVRSLGDYEGTEVLVVGWTDSSGNAACDQSLFGHRADADCRGLSAGLTA